MCSELRHAVAYLLDWRRLSRLWAPVAAYSVPDLRPDLASQGLVS